MREEQPAYDQTITVFSPDGRLYQVEYAREAVKRGTTCIGIKYKNGVALIVEKRIPSKLIEEYSIKKLFMLDKCIGCTSSGLVADTQVLVDYMRQVAQLNKIHYNEPITIRELVNKISNLKRSYTQFGGGRPFGVAFLIGGIDHNGVHLCETDVSGAYQIYDAGGIGQHAQEVNEFFESKYKKDMTKNNAMKMALKSMTQVENNSEHKRKIDIMVIEKDKDSVVLSDAEVEKYLDQL
jgi:proteasome alpha subunit